MDEKELPEIGFPREQVRPPLPYGPENFDHLYSVSIFTHLNEKKQRDWLGEIHRVLKPDGIALITFQSEHALRLFTSEQVPVSAATLSALRAAEESGKVMETGFFYEPYDFLESNAKALPGIVDTYGLTFQSHQYIYEKWSRQYDVLGVETGTVDSLQDVVILWKKHP